MTEGRGSDEYQLGIEAAAQEVNPEDIERAEGHFLEALHLGAPEFETDWIGWASLAPLFLRNGDYDRAREANERLLTFEDAMQNPTIASGALAGLSHLSLLGSDLDGAVKFADRALAIQGIPYDYQCEASYFRGRSLGMQATRMWEGATEILANCSH